MKQIYITLLCFTFFAACSSSKKVVNESNYNDLVGQNELAILKQVGSPTQVIHTPSGGKVMVYEFTETGMFLTPNKSNLKINPKKKQWTYTRNVNRTTNAPEYTIYQENTSSFKAYIDEHGKCTRVDGSVPQEYMEMRYERFKHFK